MLWSCIGRKIYSQEFLEIDHKFRERRIRNREEIVTYFTFIVYYFEIVQIDLLDLWISYLRNENYYS